MNYTTAWGAKRKPFCVRTGEVGGDKFWTLLGSLSGPGSSLEWFMLEQPVRNGVQMVRWAVRARGKVVVAGNEELLFVVTEMGGGLDKEAVMADTLLEGGAPDILYAAVDIAAECKATVWTIRDGIVVKTQDGMRPWLRGKAEL